MTDFVLEEVDTVSVDSTVVGCTGLGGQTDRDEDG